MTEPVIISVALKPESFIKLNKLAAKFNTSIREVIQEAVDEYIDDCEDSWGKIE